MMTYDKRNRETLKYLDPVVAARLEKALLVLDALDQDVLVYSGFRTEDEQNELYAKGRTKPGKIVTYVKNRDSFHCWGVAFDLVPVRFGFLQWNNRERFVQIARVLVGLGFDWGFQMWGFDYGHFQYTQGLEIEDFYMGKRLKVEPLHDIEVPEPLTTPAKGIFRRLERYLARFGISLVSKTKNAINSVSRS